MKYSLKDFDYDLPKGLIAQRPAEPRDSSRLLVYERKTAKIHDAVFKEIDKYLVKDTTLVLNDSKVEKARLKFGLLEIFITETHNDKSVTAMVYPGRKFKLGGTVELANGLSVKVVGVDEEGLRRLDFDLPLDSAVVERARLTPLPPYIKQDNSLSQQYQTVYADPLGSKAAPTAGLHFTDELLDQLAQKHQIAKITLHVGLGTFAPVKQENIDSKSLHQEAYLIAADAARTLNRAKHVTAVGTTTTRVLETVGRPFKVTSNSTEVFITPGYKYQVVDSLITNFHLPGSSLLMLVAAFTGFDEMVYVYQHAIEEKYRFYSFGDAMLVI